MKKHVILIVSLAVLALGTAAQPQRRVAEQKAAAENKPVTLSSRAVSQYPAAQTANPAEVSWKRDIYRELDLRKEANAALYYPEEPLGDRVNFFTLIFNLILEGKVNAYEYRLDGNELFDESNKLDIGDLLDNFYIYYEKKDGKYIVESADIPSGEVMKYYIKESNFIDQRASNYQTRVTAICPVRMKQEDEESYTQYPMFWLKYDDISPYLGQTQVMTSSFNNTTNMSLDDYFVMRRYSGDIYKTANLRNQPLAEYCDNDTLLMAERERIERQLVDFESGLWASSDKPGQEQVSDAGKGRKFRQRAVRENSEKEGGLARSSRTAREKTPKASRSAASSGRLSVNRGR